MIQRENFGSKITITSAMARDHHCFYVQELLTSLADAHNHKTGTIFYAGVCKLRDVLVCPDAYQNSHWRETITDTSVLRTTVMASSEREIDMFAELSSFVKTYRPTANVTGSHMTFGRAMITCIDGPNKGKTYRTQDQAALENGISQPSLSNHLNGRRGYETIRGMKFKRGMA